MKLKYKVTVLGGYSGKVAVKHFDSKQKMLNYISKVIKHASEIEIGNIERIESRWGSLTYEDWSKVNWA